MGEADGVSIEEPSDVPEVWRSYFARQRIEFTFRDLDRNVEGVSLNTIRRALLGIGTPSRRVAETIARELGISAEEFYATRAKVNGAEPTTPFTLPTSADLLNQRERDAVLSVVHALLDARDRHATQPSDTPAEEQGASSSPHTDEKTQSGFITTFIPRDQVPKPERPEDAKAARKRDPRFPPQDPDA